MIPRCKQNKKILNSLDELRLKCTVVQVQGTSGFNFEIFNPEGLPQVDKLTILITGADNSNNTPILIALRHNKSTTSTTANYENITGNKTITRRGNKYHVNADQYSRYCIYYPRFYTMYTTEGAL